MISKRYHRLIHLQIKRLHRHAKKIWYTPLISLLAFADNFLIVIPNDGVLISSSMIVPRKWLQFAIWMAVGSSLGAFSLAWIVEQQGVPLIQNYFPSIEQTYAWKWSEIFFKKYGLLFVFIVGISPLMQHPAIILAALANTPLVYLGIVIFLGRVLKFIFLSYLASHAPKYIYKLWGIKDELQDLK